MLAAALVGLTPLPRSYSFQTLGTHPSHLSAPSLPVLTAPSLPALTQPLFQRTATLSQRTATLSQRVTVPETAETLTPVPSAGGTEAEGNETARDESPSEGLIPVLPVKEEGEDRH